MAKRNQTTTLQRPKSLDENIRHLRQLLSVDTVIDDIKQEESLEFLEAIESDIATEREQHEDALLDMEKDWKDSLKEKTEELEQLESDYDELMKEADFDMKIGTIEYRASGIMDCWIMEALAEAYERLTPTEMLERLKITKLKVV